MPCVRIQRPLRACGPACLSPGSVAVLKASRKAPQPLRGAQITLQAAILDCSIACCCTGLAPICGVSVPWHAEAGQAGLKCRPAMRGSGQVHCGPQAQNCLPAAANVHPHRALIDMTPFLPCAVVAAKPWPRVSFSPLIESHAWLQAGDAAALQQPSTPGAGRVKRTASLAKPTGPDAALVGSLHACQSSVAGASIWEMQPKVHGREDNDKQSCDLWLMT